MIACPLDGATLIQHPSHKWPCMEQSGCGCPIVETCPECSARAIRAAKEVRAEGPKELAKSEARALMQQSFERRADRLRAKKRGAEQ